MLEGDVQFFLWKPVVGELFHPPVHVAHIAELSAKGLAGPSEQIFRKNFYIPQNNEKDQRTKLNKHSQNTDRLIDSFLFGLEAIALRLEAIVRLEAINFRVGLATSFD